MFLTILYIIIGLTLFFLFLYWVSDPRDGRPIHHDSRIGSFHEISNRRD